MNDELRLSVSKTKTFLDCKAKYKFSYIEKLPRKDWDFHIFGKFCHMVLEEFHRAYLEGCLLPYNIVMSDAYKKATLEYKNKMTPEMKKECWGLIDKYLRLVTTKKSTGLPANVIAVEKRFELPIENVILNGAIDRIQLDDDNVVHVCDYKTSKSKEYQKKDFFQLLTYAYVIVSEDPNIKKVRASYIMLRHNFEYITTEFDIKEILEVKNKYLKYAQQIREEQEFAPKTSRLCNYCDYLESCPEGKSVVYDNPGAYGEVSY